MVYPDNFAFGSLFALIGAFILVFIIIFIAIYIYFALALMAIANKTKTKKGWLAFIPIANVYLMTQIAKLPGWYTFALLLGLIPFIGSIALIIFFIYLWWKISERISRPGWWGILLVIPIVNLVIIGVMAWGNGKKK